MLDSWEGVSYLLTLMLKARETCLTQGRRIGGVVGMACARMGEPVVERVAFLASAAGSHIYKPTKNVCYNNSRIKVISFQQLRSCKCEAVRQSSVKKIYRWCLKSGSLSSQSNQRLYSRSCRILPFVEIQQVADSTLRSTNFISYPSTPPCSEDERVYTRVYSP